MKNVLVGQSGGPSAVINCSLYGVIKEGMESKETVSRIYGMINGIEGFLSGKVVDLIRELPGESLELLKTTPGAYLGSCRYKLPDNLENEIYATLFRKFEVLDIAYFLYIGGNDSMDTVSKLSRYAATINSPIRIIGVPKTIDNDLVLTDHTPGFGSAAKYVATTVREIGIDSSIYNTRSVTIVEIMGRNAGWLTAASVLARKFNGDNPLLIYLPEVDFDQEDFIAKVTSALSHTKNVVVCVSEGIHDSTGTFLCEYDQSIGTDNFGHKMLTGCGKYLENLVRERLGVKVRSVEFNISQRCSSAVQSLADVTEAIHVGAFGLASAINEATGMMAAFRRESRDSYELTYVLVDVNEVCNQEKTVPLEWITNEGTDLSQEFINYISPLINGNSFPPAKDGLPVFVYRNQNHSC